MTVGQVFTPKRGRRWCAGSLCDGWKLSGLIDAVTKWALGMVEGTHACMGNQRDFFLTNWAPFSCSVLSLESTSGSTRQLVRCGLLTIFLAINFRATELVGKVFQKFDGDHMPPQCGTDANATSVIPPPSIANPLT